MRIFKNGRNLRDKTIFYATDPKTVVDGHFIEAVLIYHVALLTPGDDDSDEDMLEQCDYRMLHNGSTSYWKFTSEAAKLAFQKNRGIPRTTDPEATTSPECIKALDIQDRIKCLDTIIENEPEVVPDEVVVTKPQDVPVEVVETVTQEPPSLPEKSAKPKVALGKKKL